MTDPRVQVERIGPVALLALGTIGLEPDVRAALMASLDMLEADPEIGAVVLAVPAVVLSDLAVDVAPETAPSLADLCDTVERLGRPVIAALAGCAGGALAEVALAAHFRLAPEGPCFLFPAIATGMLEGGGATQRLPRLAGAATALQLLLGGEPINAAAAQEAGLLDGIVRGDLIEAALSLADKLVEAGVAPRRVRDRGEALADRAAFHASVAAARAQGCGPAKGRILECVEAAMVLPFEAGLGFERAAARALRSAPEAGALCHVVAAERQIAAECAAVPDAATIGSVILIAGSEDASPLALALLRAGVSVTIAEAAKGREVLSRLGSALAEERAAGRIDDAERHDCLSRLRSGGVEPDAPCDLLLRVAAPDGRVPRWIGQPPAGPDPICVTAISPGDPVWDGDSESGAEIRMVATERFRPGSLTELVPGVETPPDHMQAVTVLLHRLGAWPIASGRPGRSVAGLLLGRLRAAADHLLEDGAAPWTIDAALEAAGYSSGPYRWLDRAGLSAAFHSRRAQSALRDPRERYVTVLDRLHDAGRIGQAAGRGFYEYPDGIPEGLPSEAVERIVQDARRDAGITALQIDSGEIAVRCLLALIHAGFTALGEGRARHPVEIDVVAIHGMGFPRHLGGPMYQAGRMGLEAVCRRLQDLARREDARFWAPPPILEEMVARGERFPARAPAA